MALHIDGQRRYKLEKLLGAGAFGEIYSGVDVESQDAVAVKLERADAPYPQLAYEARVYRRLANNKGIPRLYYIGVEGHYNVMVMERLGENLENLFNTCHRKFTLPTVQALAVQMLTLVALVHDEGFVHRDIKPDNFCTSAGGQICIIDFGLSKCYLNPTTREHIPFRTDKHLTGTARYASVRNHMGHEQSRRDDLESLGYVLIYFLRGRLPWQNIKKNDSEEQKYKKMMEMKQSSMEDVLQELPSAFRQYFEHVGGLAFDSRPDYAYLQSLFGSSRAALNVRFDWDRN